MAPIVGLLDIPAGRSRLESAVRIERAAGCCHRLEWALSGSELMARANGPPRPLVVLDPYASGALDLRLLDNLLGRSGALGVVVYADFAARAAQDVVAMADLGVRWVVTLGVDDEPGAIRQIVMAATQDMALQALREDACRLLPGRAYRALDRILSASVKPVRTAEIATSMACSNRTLNRVLKRADLPTAGRLIRWCRLLHAARLMEDRDRSLDQVSRVMGFSGPSNLRRLSRSLTGLGLGELVAAGGSAAIRGRILAMITRLPPIPGPADRRCPISTG